MIYHCRAYPDEKGIETLYRGHSGKHPATIAEPIPMKRELKLIISPCFIDLTCLIAEPIPMKRELKRTFVYKQDNGFIAIAEPIPMKRELKLWRWLPLRQAYRIAEPIPMKRELKRP